GPGEVLIDVHAASVNFPDLLVIGGSYQKLPPVPFVPGKDLAGTIAALGPDVTQFEQGERVMAQVEYGAYAEQAVAPAANCHRMPDSMSYAEGAAMGLVYLTAHLALGERAGLKPGETVLVTGAAGGVGLAAVKIAKALGATAIAAVSSEEKGALARASGADYVVSTAVPDLRENLRQQIHKATGKRGVDVVIDSVGGDVFDASLRALAWCGRLVIVGFAGGRIPEVKAGYLLVKNISLVGLQASDYRDREPAKVQRVQQQLFALYEKGKLKPHVMATFPLAAYREALAIVRDRKALGKVVLNICE
ncbi:MAG TPA: NADPH:quinone oxidoreductase family protein, partial [Burkholderiales bacterium]|nr:NADPH:quinone oxidoreductase family protein [Burkholderiales bacterium]